MTRTRPTSAMFGRPFDPACLQTWRQRREEVRALPELKLLCDDPSTSFLKVAAPPQPSNNTDSTQRPKILCVILTQASNHETRLEIILQTWGFQCDRFIAASDKDDPSRYAYRIEGAAEGYWGIYSKLMHTLRLILLRDIPFDWVFKADDDTHVIMENLYAFLASQAATEKQNGPTLPIIYGRTMPWPRLADVPSLGWFRTKEEIYFRKRFYEKFTSPHDRLVYVHGGPGYIMNRAYVQATVEAYFESAYAVKGLISEDMAQSFNMLYRDVLPRSTFDEVTGRERSHPESPRTMYENPHWLRVVQASIQNTAEGMACCSPTSISYHHMTPRDMQILDYQLFACQQSSRNETSRTQNESKNDHDQLPSTSN